MLTVRTESVRCTCFAPSPPDFHQLALGKVEVSLGKKGQSGTTVRNIPKKHSPTSGTWTRISHFISPFEGSITETETGWPVCVSLLEGMHDEALLFSRPCARCTRHKNGLCLKELLAQVERKIVHRREDDRMRHRLWCDLRSVAPREECGRRGGPRDYTLVSYLLPRPELSSYIPSDQ